MYSFVRETSSCINEIEKEVEDELNKKIDTINNQPENLINNMDQDLNVHIFEKFTPKMLQYLPMYNIPYSDVAQYIITNKDTDWIIENKVRAIFNHFGNKSHHHRKHKIYTNDQLKERKKEQNRLAQDKYRKSIKGQKTRQRELINR